MSDDWSEFPAVGKPKTLSPQARSFALSDDPSIGEQLLGGAKHAWDRAASGLANIFTDRPDLEQLVSEGQAFVNETGPASTVGQIGGDIAMTAAPAARAAQAGRVLVKSLPRMAPLAAEAAAMAGYGAMTADEGQGGSGAAMGALGTAGGHVLGKTMKGLVKPTAEAQELMSRGVALTPGQASGVGSFLNRAEQWAASNPIAAIPIRGAQSRAIVESNIAAAQAVANRVKGQISKGVPPKEAIEQARDLVSKAYDEGLEGMAAPTAGVERSLRDSLPNIIEDNPMMTAKAFKHLDAYVKSRFGTLARNKVTALDGNMLKQIDSEIGEQIRTLSASTTAAEKTAVPAWRELQQVLRDAMETGAQSGEKYNTLKMANTAYRELLALEKSMLDGANNFTPRQLSRQLDKRGIKGTELNKVANAMSKTLPNTVPDSGTTERVLANALLPAALLGGGAGANYFGYGNVGAGLMAAGALGTRTGSRLLTGGTVPQQFLTGPTRTAAAVRALRKGVAPATITLSREDDEWSQFPEAGHQ